MAGYSRYQDLPLKLYNRDNAGIQYRSRRFLPHAEDIRSLMTIDVREGERVDLIAHRTVGEATQWWRIADINEAMDPLELEQAGRTLNIPSTYDVNPRLYPQE